MIFQPERNNRVPVTMMIGAFLCSVVCFVFGATDQVVGQSVLQLLAICFLCVVIYVMVRYMLTTYRYVIRQREVRGDNDEEAVPEGYENVSVKSLPPYLLEFAVEKKIGKGSFVTENIIGAGNVIRFERLPADAKQRRAVLKETGKPGFKYCQNLLSADRWLLTARGSGGLVRVMVESPENEFTDYLSAVARYNREKQEEIKRRSEEE